jgi:hypothetical protein
VRFCSAACSNQSNVGERSAFMDDREQVKVL